jgi:hypothetical protein
MDRARALLIGGQRPARPRLAEAIEVVGGFDRAVIDAALATSGWRWTSDQHAIALDYVVRRPGEIPTSLRAQAGRDRLRDPREAWEMLAGRGVIPEEWVGTKARRFPQGHFASAPPTLEGVVSIASDPEGVIDAEGLALEFAARMRPWGAPKNPTPVWTIFPFEARRTTVSPVPAWTLLRGMLDAMGEVVLPGEGAPMNMGARERLLFEAFRSLDWSTTPTDRDRARASGHLARRHALDRSATGDPFAALHPTHWWMARHGDGYHVHALAILHEAHRVWQAFVASGAPLSAPVVDSMGFVTGSRELDPKGLADPFEPLLALLERGYWLLDFTRRGVRLGAVSNIDRARVDDVA